MKNWNVSFVRARVYVNVEKYNYDLIVYSDFVFLQFPKWLLLNTTIKLNFKI